MKILRYYTHPDVVDASDSIYERIAARGIIIKNEKILLIYTKRYDDYSIPGGGVDSEEGIKTALLRELEEETGAQNIVIKENFGIYEELRPTHYEGYEAMHMISHFYLCDAHETLGEANPESYEIANGSVPVWVNIDDAISHNEAVLKSKAHSMGLSIERETFVLKLIQEDLSSRR